MGITPNAKYLGTKAAHILEEGIANKASDIDMIYLTGYGFPLFRGGPLCCAVQFGLYNVPDAMKSFAANPLNDGVLLNSLVVPLGR